jgi:DNA-binding NarL/FixJ family response regulator
MIIAMDSSVLVVDDDPAFRQLASRMLKSIGLEVVAEAGTVAEALTAANTLRPAAALVDIDLPDGNGIALTQELTALPWRPRVVLTSVNSEAAGPDDVRRCGALAFVHKANLPNGTLRRLKTAD